MTCRFITLLFFLSALACRAQPATFNEVAFLPEDTIQNAYTVKQNQLYVFIPSRFGKHEIGDIPVLDSIKTFLVKDVVLVYSMFRKSDQFNQTRLNEKRWTNLLEQYPEVFRNGPTKYHNVCQSGVVSDSAAKQLTHGFYIYFENPADEKKREVEVREISKMLLSLGVDTSEADAEIVHSGPDEIELAKSPGTRHSKFRKPMRTKDPKACRQPFFENGRTDLSDYFKEKITLAKKQKRKPERLVAEVKLRLDFNGQIRSANIMARNDQLIQQIKKALSEMPLWHPAVRNGITIKSDVRFLLEYNAAGHMSLRGNVILPKYLADCGVTPDEELFDFSGKDPKEKLVPTVFNVPDNAILRDVIEREPQLDSILLVVDLTGSMGPYIAQVLDLMAELVVKNDPYVAGISLFNDGDGKKDKDKQIGKTGGVVVLDEDITLDRLGKTILKSMMRGNGGDCMENNLEAVKKGLDKCKACKDVVMIADNFATPRDKDMITMIEKPIHWILCGVIEEINVNYLDLVRENKGTLHTGRSDVTNLHLLNEGETIVIDGFSYHLKGKKFRLLKSI